MTSTGRKKPVSQSVETLLVAFFFYLVSKGTSVGCNLYLEQCFFLEVVGV